VSRNLAINNIDRLIHAICPKMRVVTIANWSKG
jgi:hypothetical protein